MKRQHGLHYVHACPHAYTHEGEYSLFRLEGGGNGESMSSLVCMGKNPCTVLGMQAILDKLAC